MFLQNSKSKSQPTPTCQDLNSNVVEKILKLPGPYCPKCPRKENKQRKKDKDKDKDNDNDVNDKFDNLIFSVADSVSCNALCQLKNARVDWREAAIKYGLQFPWFPNYNSNRLIANLSFQILPTGIVCCQTTEQVSQVVKFCRRHNLSLSVRSGGHQPAYFSIQNQIVIDISHLDHVEISRDSDHITVGGGTKLGKVYQILGAQNLLAPFGTCATVTVSQALIGGIGFLIRTPKIGGLATDHLVSAEIVLADGTIVNASNSNNDSYADLFWALRGAGAGNFGIVTKMTFAINKLKTSVSLFELKLSYDHDNNDRIQNVKKIIKKYQSWAIESDNRMNPELDVSIAFGEDSQLELSIIGQFWGPLKEMLNVIEPLLSSHLHLKLVLAKEVSLTEAYSFVNKRFDVDALIQTQFEYHKNFWMLEKFSKNCISIMIDDLYNMRRIPGYHNIALATVGGDNNNSNSNSAFSQIGQSETSFYPRQAKFWFHFANRFKFQREEESNKEYARNLYRNLYKCIFYQNQDQFKCLALPFSPPLPTYIGFPDLQDLGDQYLEAYYGHKHVPILRIIKEKYDPDNIFHYTQSITRIAPPHLSQKKIK
jgi:hypothetical protein